MNHIDCHVHVWTDNYDHYPLAEGIARDQIRPRTFYPEDILRHARANGVNRIVLIQVSYYRFDNSYMLDVIANEPKAFRGVAIVDWSASRPADRMRELKKRGVRGFRIYPGQAPPATWLEAPGFAEMFRCGAEERLAMCPLIGPDALPSLDRMCRRFPDTPVVIDHLARIGSDGTIRDEDLKSLCALADQPQVRVKVSAFYALGAKRGPYLDLVPMIRRVFEAFGARRLMWGSDSPFEVRDGKYEDSVALVRDRLDFLSPDDREWMMRRTAETVFFS